jgi:NACalpha-BTF3-like transcription factor
MAKTSITVPQKGTQKKEYKGFVESTKKEKKFTELVIKEIMVQKQVSRDEAIKILEEHS